MPEEPQLQLFRSRRFRQRFRYLPPFLFKNAATLCRFPHTAIEHHFLLLVRESSLKNNRHPAFAHRFTGAFCPSTINSAADRAIAASNHSNPLSRPINSSRHRPSRTTTSSCPSVTPNISLIGATHAFGNSRRSSTAENTARTHSRKRKIFSSTASTAPGSLPSSDSSRIPRSSLTTFESTRKSTNSVHERSCATGSRLAKSRASRPAINFGGAALAFNPPLFNHT